MRQFNAVTSAVFDLVLAPFGDAYAWFDLVVWSVLSGIAALLVYKYASNQAGIARSKEAIKVHLLEIRLFQDDLKVVISATARTLLNNAAYLGHNLLPLVVMFVPVMTVLCQIEARYAHDPLPTGSVNLLTLELDTARADIPRTASDLAAAVRLTLPDGVVLDAPPVHTATGQVAWRLRARAAGDHQLKIAVGDQVLEKGFAVGGSPRKIPVLRSKGWDALLYPGEAALDGDSPVYRIALNYPERDFAILPDGEGGILLTFFALSLLTGIALKGVFRVTF